MSIFNFVVNKPTEYNNLLRRVPNTEMVIKLKYKYIIHGPFLKLRVSFLNLQCSPTIIVSHGIGTFCNTL